MCEPVIGTYNGKSLSFINPDPAQVCIEDIAHHLSLICRFNGACSEFYSVAEHSCLTALLYLQEQGASDTHSSEMIRTALAILLHDAPEAYVGDQTRTLLAVPDFNAAFMAIFERVDTAIRIALDIPVLAPEQLRKYDDAALRLEAYALTPSRGEGWNLDHVEMPDEELDMMDPQEAEEVFMDLYLYMREQLALALEREKTNELALA